MIFNKRNHTAASLKKRNLVTYNNPDSSISDQFRTIRTNIQFLTEQRKNRIFLISSTGVGEGKSTVTANLAVSMALQNQKVLLIDANLRDSCIHSIFKISNVVGLSDVLVGQVGLEEAVQQTEIGKLEILTSGTISNNPVELLGNDKMNELIEIISKTYDMVLIDSPSVLDHTETRVLANQCHGVILVINRGKTMIDKAKEARKVLELANGKLVGAIINEK